MRMQDPQVWDCGAGQQKEAALQLQQGVHTDVVPRIRVTAFACQHCTIDQMLHKRHHRVYGGLSPSAGFPRCFCQLWLQLVADALTASPEPTRSLWNALEDVSSIGCICIQAQAVNIK